MNNREHLTMEGLAKIVYISQTLVSNATLLVGLMFYL